MRPRRVGAERGFCYPVDVNWQTSSPHASEGGPAALGIADVCSRLGLSPRTLRYYEELGLLPEAKRLAAGRRVYGADALERLRFIQRLKAIGLTLAEIRELNAVHAIGGSTRAMLGRLDELLERRLCEVDTRLAELARLRDEIDKYRGRIASRLGALGGAAPRKAR